jgi:hypothetical protein
MSESIDEPKEIDAENSKTFTANSSDSVEIPNQYEQVIADHHKSLVDIKKDLMNKTALLGAEQMKIDCLLTFFDQAINKNKEALFSSSDSATWVVDDGVNSATATEEPDNSEDNTKE